MATVVTDRVTGSVSASASDRFSGTPLSSVTDRFAWFEGLSGDQSGHVLLSGDATDGDDGLLLTGNFTATEHITDRL